MKLSEFDYELPPELTAQYPCDRREESRLLIIQEDGTLYHQHFSDITAWFRRGDLLIINETRVSAFHLDGIKTRTHVPVSFLCVERIGREPSILRAMAKPLKRLKPGSVVRFSEDISAEVLERDQHYCLLRFFGNRGTDDWESAIRHLARPALPPYIERSRHLHPRDHDRDWNRYQTVYAKVDGSIAAPTAGLHFSQELLEELRRKGVTIRPITLSIGAGTFRPVRTDDVEEHEMERESYTISPDVWSLIQETQSGNGRLIAVGTTVIRTLESAAASGNLADPCLSGSTNLFIFPGYRFRLNYGAMITNFHLPRSTLFMLVCAFGGLKRLRNAYDMAIQNRYRFYSYGDSTMIFRPSSPLPNEAPLYASDHPVS